MIVGNYGVITQCPVEGTVGEITIMRQNEKSAYYIQNHIPIIA